MMVERGDHVIVENPTYSGALLAVSLVVCPERGCTTISIV